MHQMLWENLSCWVICSVRFSICSAQSCDIATNQLRHPIGCLGWSNRGFPADLFTSTSSTVPMALQELVEIQILSVLVLKFTKFYQKFFLDWNKLPKNYWSDSRLNLFETGRGEFTWDSIDEMLVMNVTAKLIQHLSVWCSFQPVKSMAFNCPNE